MICENLPRYGVVVVFVAIIETKFTPEIEKFGTEILDMFLKRFIVTSTNVQIILKWQ
jgi:hypothetical protein